MNPFAASRAEQAMAAHTDRALDLVTTSLDRARNRAKIMDELAFDVRECGSRIVRSVSDLTRKVEGRPAEGPALCRHAAKTLEQYVAICTFPDDDPDLEQLDADGRARLISLRDELVQSLNAEGVTFAMMERAIAAHHDAARKLEGC